MSELLSEALERYQQWKGYKPPIAPPRNKYTYEEACTVMWHDGAVNAYEEMIGLIRKYEPEELNIAEKAYYDELKRFYEQSGDAIMAIYDMIDEYGYNEHNFVAGLRRFLDEVAE